MKKLGVVASWGTIGHLTDKHMVKALKEKTIFAKIAVQSEQTNTLFNIFILFKTEKLRLSLCF